MPGAGWYNDLAIQDDLVGRQQPGCVDEFLEPAGPIVTARGEEPNVVVVPAQLKAVIIKLYFMNPLIAVRYLVAQASQAWLNESRHSLRFRSLQVGRDDRGVVLGHILTLRPGTDAAGPS